MGFPHDATRLHVNCLKDNKSRLITNHKGFRELIKKTKSRKGRSGDSTQADVTEKIGQLKKWLKHNTVSKQSAKEHHCSGNNYFTKFMSYKCVAPEGAINVLLRAPRALNLQFSPSPFHHGV